MWRKKIPIFFVLCYLITLLYPEPSEATVLDTSCMDADFLNEQPPESERNQINRGERDFSVELIKSLFQDFNISGIHNNIFVSPSR